MNDRKSNGESQELIEEGEAFAKLTGLKPSSSRRRERFDVIVIGGGQAGLSVGYHLAKRGLRFVILDASDRIGDSWRKRWDSLRLFTCARYDALDGLPFPAPPDYFPTKDEMADYLESYAKHFQLPVRNGVRVERLEKRDRGYVVSANGCELEAEQVVVAMANYQHRHFPDYARDLDPKIVQVHSSEYKNPSQLGAGDVLIAGAGNSGSEIAIELSRSHRVFMSGRDTGHVPFRPEGFWGRLLLVRLVLRVLFHRLLSVRTPIGRKLRPKILRGGGPLIRVKPKDLTKAGVTRLPRIAGVRDGSPLLEDGRVLEVENIVWCTGYTPGFSWIELPIFDEHGEPRHEAGIVPGESGLYFVGLHFLYAMSSVMIHGVGRDAARIADTVSRRVRGSRPLVAKSGVEANVFDPSAASTDSV